MIRPTLAAALLATLPAVTLAQPHHQGPQDRRELRQDRRELRDDRHDLAWMEQLLARFDAARARRNRPALAAVEADVSRMLDRELRESRIEVAKSGGEARRSVTGDDRRDLRDDRRDLARVRAIHSEFTSLRGRMQRRALDRKRVLIVELTRMARAELREDRRELREDRRDVR